MPLNKRGKEILGGMKDKYGDTKGKEIFYSLVSMGKIPKHKIEDKRKK